MATGAQVKDRLCRFQEHYEKAAQPFQWQFSRHDLNKLLMKLKIQEVPLTKVAHFHQELIDLLLQSYP